MSLRLPRQRLADRISQGILFGVIVGLSIGCVVDFLHAESQDFLNGSFSEAIKGLNARADRIENMLTYVLLAVVGGLISQVIQIHAQVKHRRNE